MDVTAEPAPCPCSYREHLDRSCTPHAIASGAGVRHRVCQVAPLLPASRLFRVYFTVVVAALVLASEVNPVLLAVTVTVIRLPFRVAGNVYVVAVAPEMLTLLAFH